MAASRKSNTPKPKSTSKSKSQPKAKATPNSKSSSTSKPGESSPPASPPSSAAIAAAADSGEAGSERYPAVQDTELRMSYRIARGEQGVLSFEPYKSALLPLWRFKDPSVARKSSSELWARFVDYDSAGDFVGMDMARKFIQMGMTRAKRYANHKGGRKYAKTTVGAGEGRRGPELEKGLEFEGKAEKEEASLIFRGVWERCKGHEGYQEKKERFMKEQKEWDKERRKAGR